MGRRSYELVVSEHAPERYVRALEGLAGRAVTEMRRVTGPMEMMEGCDVTPRPSRPQVALFMGTLGGGGAERVMLDIGRLLARRGWPSTWS